YSSTPFTLTVGICTSLVPRSGIPLGAAGYSTMLSVEGGPVSFLTADPAGVRTSDKRQTWRPLHLSERSPPTFHECSHALNPCKSAERGRRRGRNLRRSAALSGHRHRDWCHARTSPVSPRSDNRRNRNAPRRRRAAGL